MSWQLTVEWCCDRQTQTVCCLLALSSVASARRSWRHLTRARPLHRWHADTHRHTCQSAATSKVVKHSWACVHRVSTAISSTWPLPFTQCTTITYRQDLYLFTELFQVMLGYAKEKLRELPQLHCFAIPTSSTKESKTHSLSYSEALKKSGLVRLDSRCEEITQCTFRQVKCPTHPLHHMLPPCKVSTSQMTLRPTYPFTAPMCKKTRYGRDLIPYCIAKKY